MIAATDPAQHASDVSIKAIDAARAFNRFYTRRLGLLDEHLHASGWTLVEARILFELYEESPVAAADLARRLGLDPAYLSRILQKFKDADLIAATQRPDDKRRSLLALTEAGRTAYAPLLERSRAAVGAMLAEIPKGARDAALRAMAELRSAFDARSRAQPAVIRPPRAGDIGWVIHRHGALYAEEYGFDHRFEGLVAEVAGRFLSSWDPAREGCWVADQGGRIVGSIFLARIEEARAQLRLLYVEPDCRGLGLGRALLDACLGFARNAGYDEVMLWTNDVLSAARRLYESVGFQLTDENKHAMFGPEMTGQTFSLTLE